MHASFSERKKTEGNQGATSPALKWQLSQEHPSGSVRVATSDANQPLLTEKKKTCHGCLPRGYTRVKGVIGSRDFERW